MLSVLSSPFDLTGSKADGRWLVEVSNNSQPSQLLFCDHDHIWRLLILVRRSSSLECWRLYSYTLMCRNLDIKILTGFPHERIKELESLSLNLFPSAFRSWIQSFKQSLSSLPGQEWIPPLSRKTENETRDNEKNEFEARKRFSQTKSQFQSKKDDPNSFRSSNSVCDLDFSQASACISSSSRHCGANPQVTLTWTKVSSPNYIWTPPLDIHIDRSISYNDQNIVFHEILYEQNISFSLW